MTKLKITAGPYNFVAKLETEAAPKTCAAFLKALPFISEIIHVRWSGEGVWMPLGDLDFGVGYENATSHPSFASKAGPLAGNHFLSIIEGMENVHPLGRMVLLKGAQPIRFDLM